MLHESLAHATALRPDLLHCTFLTQLCDNVQYSMRPYTHLVGPPLPWPTALSLAGWLRSTQPRHALSYSTQLHCDLLIRDQIYPILPYSALLDATAYAPTKNINKKYDRKNGRRLLTAVWILCSRGTAENINAQRCPDISHPVPNMQ